MHQTATLPALAKFHPRAQRRAWPAGISAIALLAPSVLFLFAFTCWPIATTAVSAFAEQSFGQPPRWGIGNFSGLFSDAHFTTALVNSALYALPQ